MKDYLNVFLKNVLQNFNRSLIRGRSSKKNYQIDLRFEGKATKSAKAVSILRGGWTFILPWPVRILSSMRRSPFLHAKITEFSHVARRISAISSSEMGDPSP